MTMRKGEVKERGKAVFLVLFLLLFFLFIFLAASFAAAYSGADVAYIYKKDYKVDENVLGVFSELGLSYELIDERYISLVNFSKYKLIFVGDERYENGDKIPVDEKPSVIVNYYFG